MPNVSMQKASSLRMRLRLIESSGHKVKQLNKKHSQSGKWRRGPACQCHPARKQCLGWWCKTIENVETSQGALQLQCPSTSVQPELCSIKRHCGIAFLRVHSFAAMKLFIVSRVLTTHSLTSSDCKTSKDFWDANWFSRPILTSTFTSRQKLHAQEYTRTHTHIYICVCACVLLRYIVTKL